MAGGVSCDVFWFIYCLGFHVLPSLPIRLFVCAAGGILYPLRIVQRRVRLRVVFWVLGFVFPLSVWLFLCIYSFWRRM